MKFLIVFVILISYLAPALANVEGSCPLNTTDNLSLPEEIEENVNALIKLSDSFKNKNLPEEDCIIGLYKKTTKGLADEFLDRLNELFKTKIKYKYESHLSPLAFSVDTAEKTISFPKSYLNKVCRGDASVNEMYFILSHEFAHTLIESDDFRVDGVVEKWVKKLKKNESDIFDTHINELSHINTDAIAAKMMNFFELPIDDGIKWLESFIDIMPERKKYHIYWEKRPDLLKKAYSEGSSGWSGLNKIFPLCNVSKISVLFNSEQFEEDISSSEGDFSYIKEMKKMALNIPENCNFYSSRDVQGALEKWGTEGPTLKGAALPR